MYFSLLRGSQPITVETSRGQGSERAHDTASTVRRERAIDACAACSPGPREGTVHVQDGSSCLKCNQDVPPNQLGLDNSSLGFSSQAVPDRDRGLFGGGVGILGQMI